MGTVRELLELQAQRRSENVYALATETGATLTYGELAAGLPALSAWLDGHGAPAGSKVAMVMPNGLMTLRLLLSAMASGRCVVPVNLLSQPEVMRYVMEHSDCALVLAAPEWAERVRDIAKGLPCRVAVADPDALRLPKEPATGATPPRPQAQDTALLMYTSGTTGRPKGVMLSQSNLAANAGSIVTEHALTERDRVLGVLPLYHINAFAVTMLAPLASGGSVAMAPKFSVQRFWDQALGCGCTWINVVPTMISYLLAGTRPQADLSRLRFARSASAALPPEHLRSFEQTFGIGVIETMGLTETTAPCFSNPLDPARRKLGSVGRPSGCEAQVIDGKMRPVPVGTTGELAIRGPNVMKGYYKDAEATVAAFTPDGWLRTGDLGYRDADGFFFVTGRIKELIIKGGENIAPREIDEALLRHPAVLDAAAVGIPDPHYGQEILACVVLREGAQADESALRAFCEQQLGRYKTPKVFRFVPDLPRGPSGKVQRLKLAET